MAVCGDATRVTVAIWQRKGCDAYDRQLSSTRRIHTILVHFYSAFAAANGAWKKLLVEQAANNAQIRTV